MPVKFTDAQESAFHRLQEFANSQDRCMILKGYAGTGKTFLIGYMAAWLEEQHIIPVLLAPTGRAARVITDKTRRPGSTIHRHIYNLDELIEHDDKHARFKFYFHLKSSALDETRHVIIVDESSMVSDVASEGEFIRFGSGRLLLDLFSYARMDDPTQFTKIIFVGDHAQLPPVGMNCSPALDPEYLQRGFGLSVQEIELTEVVRQAADSKILIAATEVRENIRHGRFNQLCIEEAPPEIVPATSDEVADLCKQNYKSELPPSFVCITYANDTALRYNILTRAKLWGGNGEQPVQPGDFLMVVANNRATGLLNGDLALVVEADDKSVPHKARLFVDGKETHVTLTFRSVTLAFDVPGSAQSKIRCCILENVLYSNRRDISPEEQKALYVDFKMRRDNLKPNTKAFTEAISEDPYFNAVRVKFGYAATCHKAQGGEWDSVAVIFEHQRTDKHAQRWVYTAITRAKKRLYGVNLPSRTPWDGIFTNPVRYMDRIEEEPENSATETGDLKPLSPLHELPVEAPDFVRNRHHEAIHAWEEEGIRVDGVYPNIPSYHVRYALSKDGKEITLNIYFNNRGRFTPQPQPSAGNDPELVDFVINTFEQSRAITFPPDEPFLKDFHEQAILPRVQEAGCRIATIEHRQYAVRYSFVNDDGGRSVVDYHYDGRRRFTTSTVISGIPPF